MQKNVEITKWNVAIGMAVWAMAFIGVICIVAGITNCTPTQRAIVRSVTEVIDEVCGDKDSIEECLSKAQMKQAAKRAAQDGGAK